MWRYAKFSIPLERSISVGLVHLVCQNTKVPIKPIFIINIKNQGVKDEMLDPPVAMRSTFICKVILGIILPKRMGKISDGFSNENFDAQRGPKGMLKLRK